jgi:iron complex transport system permease protein
VIAGASALDRPIRAASRSRKTRPILAVAGAALLATLAIAVLFGAEPVSLMRALGDGASLDRTILLDVRTPRVLLAAIAGAGLAVVGASFQALLRNPLAEPFVLGVSGGAALGASIAIALGVSSAFTVSAMSLGGVIGVPAAAFAGGLGATVLVYVVARGAPASTSGTTVLLAGVMVNSIASALITFLKTLVAPWRAQQLLRWLTGSIEIQSPLALAAIGAYVALGSGVLLWDAARLNLLALGDEEAASLGLDVRALERRVVLASSAVVGAIVSVTGLIGFIGLIVPHGVRRVAGSDHRLVLPLSMLLGAASLVACDLLARLSFRWISTEPPVGAVTALVGGPIFLVLLKRAHR